MIFFLTGEVNSGKTSLLTKWVDAYLREGRRIGGVLAPANWREGKKISYDIIDIEKEEPHLLASVEPLPDAERFGRFWFSRNGLALAESALMHLDAGFDIGVVDEVGPLELEGRGLANGLRAVLTHPPTKVILVVRNSLIGDVARTFRLRNYQVLTINSPCP